MASRFDAPRFDDSSTQQIVGLLPRGTVETERAPACHAKSRCSMLISQDNSLASEVPTHR